MTKRNKVCAACQCSALCLPIGIINFRRKLTHCVKCDQISFWYNDVVGDFDVKVPCDLKHNIVEVFCNACTDIKGINGNKSSKRKLPARYIKALRNQVRKLKSRS